MDPAIIVGLLALAGTSVTAYGSWAGKKGDKQGAFTDDLLQRVTDLEKSMRDLRTEFDAERGLRIRWENHAWDLTRSLKRSLDALHDIAIWIGAGAKPPPPDVQQTIEEIEEAIKSID